MFTKMRTVLPFYFPVILYLTSLSHLIDSVKYQDILEHEISKQA